MVVFSPRRSRRRTGEMRVGQKNKPPGLYCGLSETPCRRGKRPMISFFQTRYPAVFKCAPSKENSSESEVPIFSGF